MSRFGASGADEPQMDELERAIEAYLQLLEAGGDVDAFITGHPLRDELKALLEMRSGLHADVPEPSNQAYLRGLAAVEAELRLRARRRRRWRLPRLRFWVLFGGMGLGLAVSAGVAAGPGPVPQLSSLLQTIPMTQTPSVTSDNATVTPEAEPSATPQPPVLQLPLADTGAPVTNDTPTPDLTPPPATPPLQIATPAPPTSSSVIVLPPIATPVDTLPSGVFQPPTSTSTAQPSATPALHHTPVTSIATPTPVAPTSTAAPPTLTPTPTRVYGTPTLTPTPTPIRIIVTPGPTLTKTPGTGADPGGDGGECPNATETPTPTPVYATPVSPRKSLIAKTPTPCVDPTQEPAATPTPDASGTPAGTPSATPDGTDTPTATPTQPGGLVAQPGNDSVDCEITPDDPSCIDAPSKSKPQTTPAPQPDPALPPLKSSSSPINATLFPEQETALGRRRRRSASHVVAQV